MTNTIKEKYFRILVWFLLQNLGEFLFLILLRECGWESFRTNWHQLPIYFLHVWWGNWMDSNWKSNLLVAFKVACCLQVLDLPAWHAFFLLLSHFRFTSTHKYLFKNFYPWSFLFISLLSIYASCGDYSARFVDIHCFCFPDWILGFLRARIISVSLCFAWRCTHKPDWK